MNLDHETMMEHAVLGSFLIESSMSDKADFILDELSETDFNRDSSRRMFRVFKEMHANEESIDLVTVCAKLKAKGELDTIGGEVFVCSLMDSVSTTNHIRHYAGKVRKNAVMRKIRREISQLNPEAEPEAVERVMQLVQERDTDDGVSVVTPKAFMDELLEECMSGRSVGIKTGYPTLDDSLHAQGGDLVVVAARTNVGKTTFLANILHNLLERNICCLYCATEMRPKQFMGRVLPLKTCIPATSFRSHQFRAEDIAEMQSVTDEMKALPLHLLDIASPTIHEVKRAIRTSGCKVVFIDYLGRCSMSREVTRMREIEKFVVELKNECVKSGILCFLAVQLNRRTDFDNTAPKLADLSDSSAVEKEADAVVFLWRNPKVKSDSHSVPVIEAFFGKNRFGYMHKWGLSFNRTTMRMTECELEYKDEYDKPAKARAV